LKRKEHVEPCEKKPASRVKPKESSGGREADLLRRIKREWRDAVKLGIAYDWMKMQTLKSSDTMESDKYKYVRIGPLGKNLLQWHFSVTGPPNSEYEGGIYHGRVLLPKDYPASPPRIQVLTPSGRFITGEDICLSASSFHPESWTPRWTVLSLVDALRLHMLTTANEIGGKYATPDERRRYARASRQWHLGRIDHRVMVKDGIFPWHDERVEMPADVMVEKEGDGSVQMAVRRTPEARVRKHRSQNSKLLGVLVHAVVEALTSPPCLALLLILTAFVILNRH
jgi:ubiquitin-protein ligase